ncbi:universal stress protein [bacterium]|nr:universal stress protein [bacterium]
MKLMVGYDGSGVALDALKLAFDKAKKYGGEIDVIKSVEQSHTLKYEEIRRLEQTLENEVKEICDDDSVPYRTHVIVTHQTAGDALVEFAKDQEIEEIIIGIRRQSKVGKLVFGSTAQHVILNAHCPVLTIK